MKFFIVAFLFCVAQLSFAQSSSSDDSKFPLPQQDVPGMTEQAAFGNGRGVELSMFHHIDGLWFDVGIITGDMMPVVGANAVPIFAAVKKDLWSHSFGFTRSSFYAFAGAGPMLGLWSNPTPTSFSNFMSSLAFRPGVGGLASMNADFTLGNSGYALAMGAGYDGFAFTSNIGPHKAYAGAFFSVGLRFATGK